MELILKCGKLTTDHSGSSYGIPVLVIGSQAFGPGDALPIPSDLPEGLRWMYEQPETAASELSGDLAIHITSARAAVIEECRSNRALYSHPLVGKFIHA